VGTSALGYVLTLAAIGRWLCTTANWNVRRPSWVDAVEKGKNELIEILTCVPVETGIS
jgi:hypothetical protein